MRWDMHRLGDSGSLFFQGKRAPYHQITVPLTNLFRVQVCFLYLKNVLSLPLTPEIIEPCIRRFSKNPKGKLLKADFEKVIDVSFSGKNITNIDPLVKLTSVKNVSLIDNQIKNLGPLASLKNLGSLQLQGNKIATLKPLSDLTTLKRLNLSRNQIKNIAPVASLINLEWLNLISNNVTDLSALAKMTELRWLGLNYNSITDLKPLRGLKQLKALMVKGNPHLDDSEVEELEEELPSCKIEY